MTGNTTPLTFKQRSLRRRVSGLFEELAQNEEVRNSFIENPSEIIETTIYPGKRLNPQDTSEANRLLFSLLSNDGFMSWISRYAETNADTDVSREQFLKDFARVLPEFSDENTTLSLLTNSLTTTGIASLISDDVSSTVAKEYSYSVTEVNNSGVAAYNKSYTVTENKTKGIGGILDEEIRRVVNPAELRSISEQLINYAKELKQSGRLANLDSEIR
jgi:hypothetical protein